MANRASRRDFGRKGSLRAQVRRGPGFTTKRADGSTYHQDRLRWPSEHGQPYRKLPTTPPQEAPTDGDNHDS